MYLLEDLEVWSVGLVPQGANQEEFFLLKHIEGSGDMTDELILEELEDEGAQDAQEPEAQETGLLRALARLLRKAEQTPVQAAAKEILQAIRGIQIPPELTWIVRALEAAAAGKPMKGPTPYYGYPQPVQAGLELPSPGPDPEVASKLAALEKANEDLRAQLEQAIAQANAEREARRLQELEAELRSLDRLPGSPGEIAATLHWMEKQGGQEHLERMKRLLEGVQAALQEADWMREIGTAQASQLEPLEKASKLAAERGIPLDEAVLSIPASEQREYILSQRRARR